MHIKIVAAREAALAGYLYVLSKTSPYHHLLASQTARVTATQAQINFIF
jgi:hypothetical protein